MRCVPIYLACDEAKWFMILINWCNFVPADDGCLQYYTGVSGKIKSYNYDPMTGLQLSNQDYSICIRSERNFCSIQYSTCTDAGKHYVHFFINPL